MDADEHAGVRVQAVGLASGEELLGVPLIDFQPLGLAIGAAGAVVFLSRRRPFGPVQAQPAQVVEQLSLKTRLAAFDVRVFNTQQKVAARSLGKEPVVERGAGIANMQKSGGRRGKTDTSLYRSHTFRW